MPSPWRRGFSEAWWTLVAVGLTLATGGAMLWLISLSGGTWWLDDFQSQWLPGYMDMNRALREGSFPLLSTASWNGGDFAGEFQYGVFSVAHLSIVLLVFQWNLGLLGSAAAFMAIYAAILSSGVFRLGRHLGLNVPFAIIAALAATLNGYVFYWGAQSWFPALASFAWLPWTWLAMECALDARRGAWRFVPAGLSLYLLIAAGWPFSVLMAGTVIVWLSIRSWPLFRSGKAWPIPAACVLGVALAMPAILSLLEYHTFTKRSATWSYVSKIWNVPVSAFGGAMVPAMPAGWSTFRASFEKDIGPEGLRHSTETFGGLVPYAALLAMLLRRRKTFIHRHRWELALLGLTVVLCHCGAVGAFRWSFRWLPLFHLCIGLLGGFALQEWSASEEPTSDAECGPWFTRCTSWVYIIAGMVAGAVCIESPEPWRTLIAFAVAVAVFSILYHCCRRFARARAVAARLAACPGCWASLFVGAILAYVWGALPMVATSHFIVVALLLLCISLLWLIGDILAPGRPQWLPVAIMVPCLIVGVFRPGHTVPYWPFADTICQTGPLDQNRTYYAVLTRDDVFRERDSSGEVNRFGNAMMYAGLSFVNGYSPMDPVGLAKVFRFQGLWNTPEVSESILRNYLAPDGLFSQMGVDGLVLGHSLSRYTDLVLRSGWSFVGRYPHGTVFHRFARPAPRVRSLPTIISIDSNGKIATRPIQGIAAIDAVQETRLSVRCHVKNASQEHDAVVAFSRAYYPGYRAYFNGVETPVEAIAGIQPGVRIAPNADGELLLVFRPKSMQWGLGIAATAAIGTVLFLMANAMLGLVGKSRR